MTFEVVRGIIAEQLKIDEEEITQETSFANDLDVDSLDLFQILSDLETRFDIIIDSDGKFETVSDVVEFIDLKLAEKNNEEDN